MTSQDVTGKAGTHGTAIVLGPRGVLITGPSGAGKSLLALDLIEQAGLRGAAAFLLSDDRVHLRAGPQGPVMEGPPAIAGMIELRGRGIVTLPSVTRAPLHLVVDLVESVERMPEEEAFSTRIAGAVVPRCPVPRRGIVDGVHQRLLVHAALRALAENRWGGAKRT